MSRKISYRFDFEGDKSWEYELEFDKQQHFLAPEQAKIKPWTLLEFRKCPHCPLTTEESLQCPVARNLDHIVEDSKETLSIKRATVTVNTPERNYSKECATQEGLLSLFGLIMASSGCPHLDWLRPLARFHLPFGSIEETLFRVLSLQLLTQYFTERDSNLQGSAGVIEKNYEAVEVVNHAFIQRIREYCEGDADKNAIAALDVFVQLFRFQRDSDFSDLAKLFESQGFAESKKK